jgi:TonB-linked SusC/RagA family outer membrane protein
MRKKFNVFLTLLLALVVQITFAQEKSISGVVTDATDGSPLPGVNVTIKGTNKGAATDFDGKYTIKAKDGDVVQFSFVGYSDVSKKVGTSNNINVAMKEGQTIGTVIIEGPQGIKEKPVEVSYAQQVVKAKDLGIGKDNNIKTALSGKVSGVTVSAQAGSKLGQTGKVYLRGAISALGRAEAIFIVDGMETSSDNVDMENVASINVLKGPAAVALYGLRGADGVIVITTKSGKKGKLNVSIFNNTTFDKVAYLPNYQNEYGQGYQQSNMVDYSHGGSAPAEWSVLDGVRYNRKPYADESWGAKFDGEAYAPWYAWWPGENGENPYFGKTQKWVAQPDNIKDFYQGAVQSKSGFSISGGNDLGTGRLSYSRLDQTGLMPNTDLGTDIVSGKFKINLTEKLKVGLNATYSNKKVNGNFDDSYGNAVSGSFNQWFGRDLEMDKLRELKNLKTTQGFHASWNWWGSLLTKYDWFGGDTQKPVFWFNPYWQLDQEVIGTDINRLVATIDVEYKVNDKLKLTASGSKSSYDYHYNRKTPYVMQYNSNADVLGYTSYLNSMTDSKSSNSNTELKMMGNYKHSFSDKLGVDVFVGGTMRNQDYNSLTSSMSREGKHQTAGFAIPDVYDFRNSKELIKPNVSSSRFKTNTVFTRARFNYNDYLFVTGDISNVWDSRYDIIGLDNSNSFMFGSLGLSFVYSKAMKMPKFIDFGKLRLSYAAAGTEIGANTLNPGYRLGGSYNNTTTMFSPNIKVAPGTTPATSTGFEIGTDMQMLNKRLKFTITYFDEHRKDEIFRTEVAQSSGISTLIANAGDVHRTGIEMEIAGTPIKTKDFRWNIAFNFANPYVKVLELAPNQKSQYMSGSSFGVVSVLNLPGKQYGQIRGTAIKRDDAGNAILNADGLYELEANHDFGSVLPDFNGGVINSFSYKGFTLAGTINYQKGGKFFSLTEWWGTYTGLLEVTAGDNDRNKPKRDDVADGGGVHITGVDGSGNAVDTYIGAKSFYQQQYPTLAEGFIHDASYIKLAEVSLSYKFPKSILGKYIKGASVGIVARNLGMIAVSSENKHNWDPSEFGYLFGDDAQLPGTRSFGFNVRLTL